MGETRRRRRVLIAGVMLLSIVAMWVFWPSSQGPLASPGAGEIVLAFGPGGVLTRDGGLWQYRPDTGKWLTVDQGFREQGLESHVQPLPVPVEEIADMVSFGFILTKSGTCWLFDVEKDRWIEAGTPGG